VIPQPIDTVPLFQRLTAEERQLVTAHLRRRQAAPGEALFTEGQPSDTLFIITTGWVKLEGGNVDQSVTLANLGAGSLVGESDLLLNRPYSMTARATGTTPTQLLTLTRTDLEELIRQRPSIGLKFSAGLGLRIPFLEQYLVQQRLRNIELLSALSDDDLRAIAQVLEFQTLARGDRIIERGAPGDAAFILEEGHVRLITQASDGETFEELEPGAIFGHTALCTSKPYAMTARAVSDVTLWVLTRQAYQGLIERRTAIKLAFSRALAESLSISDQADAVERMCALPLFNDMPTDALHALAARLVLRQFPNEEAIYTEGTPGDAMYIVESGEVKLMDSAFSDAHLLERIRPGEAFGEMALLTGRTRAECARAATDTTLWVLYKSDFDDVMVQYPEISISLSRALTERLSARENDFVIRHLRRINLFSNLASSELKQIATKVRGIRFRPGEIICFAGQPANAFYMIESGEVKRMTTGAHGEPIMLGILDSGDSFGEQEIVQGIPYQATAQALSDVEIWTIAKNDFQQMLEAFPALTLTITRMMADRLARAQHVPPTARVQQPNLPPRPPMRPGSSLPPTPPRRIQQPPSGARPIKPLGHTPGVSHTASPTHLHAEHKPMAASLGIARQHTQTAARPHNEPPRPAPVAPMRSPRPAPRARSQGPGFFAELGMLITGLSLGGKLRALTLAGLAVWFLVIVGPFTTVSTVSSAVGGLQLANSAAGSNGATSEKELPAARSNSAGPAKVAFAIPTNTPVPTRTPAPTFTPRPQPTAVRIVPTRTPVPPPVAAAAPPPAPALPPPEVDPRLVPGSGKDLPHINNFKIIPATVARGQKFWRITKVVFEDIAESGNGHSIYVMLRDESGKRTEAKVKWWGENTGDMPDDPQKSADDVCNCNYALFMYGDAYGIMVSDQYPSDKATGMIMPMKRHVNYRVYYQLTTMP
jgi:CRP-like cAMP-binding protein